MAIQIQGNGGTIADVDGTTWRSLRMTGRPEELTGAYTISLAALTAAAPVAAANLVSFRWTSATQLCLIKSIQIKVQVSTASTAGLPEMACYVARSFTASDTGGTAVALTGNLNKARTSHATSAFSTAGGDIRFASAGVLTAGTRTLDTYPIAAISVPLALGSMDTVDWESEHSNDHPIVLAQNEGLVFQNVTAITAGIYRYQVRIIWHESNSY